MTLLGKLHELESAGLIRLGQYQPELVYLFRHTLVQEAAYDSLLRNDRRLLHRHVAEVLERLNRERREDLAPLLAYHYHEGGDDDSALENYTLAADSAARQFANGEAVMHYTHALEIARRRARPLSRLYRARGSAYEILGEFERARADRVAAAEAASHEGDGSGEWQALLELGMLWAGRDYMQSAVHYRHALERARALDDPRGIARSLNHLGNWHVNAEQPGAGLAYHQEALAVFQRLGDERGVAETHDLLGLTYFEMGDLVQSAAEYERAIALFRSLGDRVALVNSLSIAAAAHSPALINDTLVLDAEVAAALGEIEEAIQTAREIGWRAGEAYAEAVLAMLTGSQGDYTRAFPHARAGLALAVAIEHRQWTVAGHWSLGVLYDEVAAAVPAQEHLERALSLAKDLGSVVWHYLVSGSLGLHYAFQHEPARALSLLEPVIAAAPATQSLALRLVWYARAEAALASGEPAQALEIVERLIATAANRKAGTVIPRLWKVRGEAMAGLGQYAQAEDALRAARAEAAAQGRRPLVWQIDAALGRVFRAQGRSVEAERAFASARALMVQLAAGVPEAAVRENFLRYAARIGEA